MRVFARFRLSALVVIVAVFASYFAGFKSGLVEAERRQTVLRQEQREELVEAAIERTKNELVQALLEIHGVTAVPTVQTDWKSMDAPGRETYIELEVQAQSARERIFARSRELAQIFLCKVPSEAVTIELFDAH
jgi:hypothetical protein